MTSSFGPMKSLLDSSRFRRWAIMPFLICTAGLFAGAPGAIDSRNFIPDVLDAPVCDVDGTNRLAGDAYLAQLFCGETADGLAPYGSAAAFGTGVDAGYWHERDAPQPTAVLTPYSPGQRVWIQVRAWERSRSPENWDNIPPARLWGRSETFSIVISNTPTPLIGLKPFRLEPAPLREIRREGDEVVLRWSAGDGTAHYSVEVSQNLAAPTGWHRAFGDPQLVITRQDQRPEWYADWVLTNMVAGPAAFYRIALLNH